MIVNLERFVEQERPKWERLDSMLARIREEPWRTLTLEEVRELEMLYRRAASDLARLSTFAAEQQARAYLDGLVARGYAEIHGEFRRSGRFSFLSWATRTLPQAWRRRRGAFVFALAVMLAGGAFGGLAIAFDPASKPVLISFPHLQESPSERVAREERSKGAELMDRKARFSGMLMTHNTGIALESAAFGMTWGIGTVIVMFTNGVTLGALVVDYVGAGETKFLLGWLLPHGVIEIPATLIGGQAGFVLAGAILGRGKALTLRRRLRAVVPDVVTLCVGAALMLVWAGVVEAFLSQYHEPVLPYWVKILFGGVELCALAYFYLQVGRDGAVEKGPDRVSRP